ncbi:MAG: 6-carboxytetrahydropterin synthase [Deltaproteobacteria bacterium]|nr:6-carboxytetrahydropterin synthase [Candidatus Zymogenaceae bacterium]
MYEVSVKDHFSAAHQLTEVGGGCEKLHGHNFTVEVFVRSETLTDGGTVIDFRVLKTVLAEVLTILDHTFLNDLDAFQNIGPSSERLARFIHGELSTRLAGKGHPTPFRVDVWESENSRASYME